MHAPNNGVILSAALLLLALPAAAGAMGSRPAAQQNEKDVLERIRPVAHVEFAAAEPAAAAAQPAASGRSGADIVKSVCAVCHDTGAAGAPKVGDKAAWAPRLAQGLDGLVKSATAGKGAMPPKGGAADLTPVELTRAVVWMANKSGANFKEPQK